MDRCYHLENRNGEKNTFLIRQRKAGEEKGMIECIRDEYGNTYFKQDFYDEKYLLKEADEGNIVFLVAEVINDSSGAEDNREIAGMMILKECGSKNSACEIASQIIKKKYRGYGLAMLFFEYGMSILENQQYSSTFCLPVLFHDVTQRLMRRCGLVATGMIMNVFDVEGIIHSYDNGGNTKHSQGIQVKRISKRDAGILYLPKEHVRFCKRIYKKLGVKCKVAHHKRKIQNSAMGFITCKQNEKQHSLEIYIYAVGQDVVGQVEGVLKNHPLIGKQTANIFLNINDKRAAWAYEKLKEEGWFFTGLRPLCGDWEYMVLHNAGEVQIVWDNYVLSDEFKEIVNYIFERK